MGFSENVCRRACLATKNAGVQQAMNWVLDHMAKDPDFNDPPAPAGGGGGADDADDADDAGLEDGVMMLMESTGFPSHHCRAALKRTGKSVEAAAEFLLTDTSPQLDIMAAEDL